MVWQSRAERIARIADAWAVRSAGPLSAEEQAERDSWRAADPAHEAAYARARVLFSAAGGIRRPAGVSMRASRWSFGPATAFAGIAAIVLAGGAAFLLNQHRPESRPTTMVEFATTADSRQVRLSDGTMLDLDPGSAARTDFSGPIRAVLLERGTARFDVAHDAHHPFVVTASDRKVTAIGTRFEVALKPHGLVVTLFQGAVEVARRASSPTTPPVRLSHGQRLTIDDDRQSLTRMPDVAAARVQDVDPTPVADIIAKANNAAPVPIRLADPALGARLVQGRFDLGDTAALAVQLGAALDLSVTRSAHGYLLTSH